MVVRVEAEISEDEVIMRIYNDFRRDSIALLERVLSFAGENEQKSCTAVAGHFAIKVLADSDDDY